jgi:predicted metalloprotease
MYRDNSEADPLNVCDNGRLLSIRFFVGTKKVDSVQHDTFIILMLSLRYGGARGSVVV